jgi:hypothetical protein
LIASPRTSARRSPSRGTTAQEIVERRAGQRGEEHRPPAEAVAASACEAELRREGSALADEQWSAMDVGFR